MINLAGSSTKHVALLALILFNIQEICSTVTLTRPNILSDLFMKKTSEHSKTTRTWC